MGNPQILFCNCAYAQVVPLEVKAEVLAKLCESGRSFHAVPDLCEMSARKDASLREATSKGAIKIAACFPRAVKGLFGAAGTPLSEETEILNMRTLSAGEVVRALLAESLTPNVPSDKAASPAPSAAILQ